MIQQLHTRFGKTLSFLMFCTFYTEFVLAAYVQMHQYEKNYSMHRGNQQRLLDKLRFEKEEVSYRLNQNFKLDAQDAGFFGNGPGQPEMQSFTPVSNANMVDLFTGDFSYNIPLLDVGGYPVNISYRSGITMDQEASWVGLGWNINPGTITRNLRGLPDDFNGNVDTIRKTASVKDNKTIGVTAGADVELIGYPKNKPKVDSNRFTIGNVGASLGIFHNSYKGWGIENGLNASINAGAKGASPLTAGLSLTNNSQDGFTISPSLSVKFSEAASDDHDGTSSSFSLSLPYNTRAGLKGLQMSTGVSQTSHTATDQRMNGQSYGYGSTYSSFISFASPSYTPSISLPYTSGQFSFTAKIGIEKKPRDHSFYLTGYVSTQKIAPEDKTLSLPAFGYLNYQNGSNNPLALMDFNREKEIPYREKPSVPNIAIPSYTYDIFSISGEGTGGMFRAYRSDVGFVRDHFMRTKDNSQRFSVDLGFGDLFHGGVDINLNRSFSQSGDWTQENATRNSIGFTESSKKYEAVYFKNPGEKTAVSKSYFNALGGDDVVAVKLFQPGSSSSSITATNYFNRYQNKRVASILPISNPKRNERDKRTQVVTYLTADEASLVGLSKFIEIYQLNKFPKDSCNAFPKDEQGTHGLQAYYFRNTVFAGNPTQRIDNTINNRWGSGAPSISGFQNNHFSVRWLGRLKAPITGRVTLKTNSDDGIRLWVNDSLVINHWSDHAEALDTVSLNLIKDQLYKVRVEYYERSGGAIAQFFWSYNNVVDQIIPTPYLYTPVTKDTFHYGTYLLKEKRVNNFRKSNHISEIDVLSPDGRRYVYGVPIYNLKQREATFSVDPTKGNSSTGFVKYDSTTDNSVSNSQGVDGYFNAEEIPAYAHSYLITGILSPDYVDQGGDGISDDDIGDAIKFNYTRISGITNPYKWRAPYRDSANYNPGLKTYSRDDKGSYVYGEKELWYLNSIESKNMIATFVLANRADGWSITENGIKKTDSTTKLLKEIRLYTKAAFLKNPNTAVPIKTVHFEYSYELCKGINKPVNDTGKLTLKKIWFTYNGNNKGQQNPYVFSYNPVNPTYDSKSFDRWGNYKSPASNIGGLSNAEYPYSLQSHNETDSTNAKKYAAAWTLDQIKLPSGGMIKVDYETDDYAYVQNRRAMEMFSLAGFASSSDFSTASNNLYNLLNDNLYAFINVPVAPTSTSEVYSKYLEGIKKLYFKASVKMPSDKWGSGSEFIPCYANIDLEASDAYGITSNDHVIWVKLKGINAKSAWGGSYNPIAKAAIQFLRLNLPSKAYPGSEPGDNIALADAVKMVFGMADNIVSTFQSFDFKARLSGFAKKVDLEKSFVRLTDPFYKKNGGGIRVKRISIYDNWKTMTNQAQKEAVYGQEYSYTTTKEINGIVTAISSGVATYEPSIGNDENPFHLPIEYTESVAPLAPVNMGYVEEPLCESFFPAPSVGYSKVSVRSINTKNKKSANGYEESGFYTAYDYPTLVDWSLIDGDSKKRFKPALQNFLRINAKHYMAVSQGFKIELNDMHGKPKFQATYPETDSLHPITYTESFYKSVPINAQSRKLSNEVWTMKPDGAIDTMAIIGKDLEVMIDMREQKTIVNGNNFNINGDLFTAPSVPPLWLLPSLLNLAQREETKFNTVATMKVIQRYGIVDSVVHIDKGSKVSTKNILYDDETGDVLLTRTQNEFNDPIYNFNYPAYWAYDGMGMAYKNVNVLLDHIFIKNGKITSGLGSEPDSVYFASGDEILISSKPKTGDSVGCGIYFASFPVSGKIWAFDKKGVSGGVSDFYFIDEEGKPFSGNDVSMKIIRSGRRNLSGSVGSVTTMRNPLTKNGSNQYEIRISDTTKVLNASVAEYQELWKVADRKKQKVTVNCINDADCATGDSCVCNCLRNFFDYIIQSKRWVTVQSDSVTVQSLVTAANSAGYNINTTNCPILANNLSGFFYTTTSQYIFSDSVTMLIGSDDPPYTAVLGNCILTLRGLNEGNYIEQYNFSFHSMPCSSDNKVYYATSEPPVQITSCKRYTVNYWDTLAMISYRRCDGVYVTNQELSPTDSIYSVCAEQGSLSVVTGTEDSLYSISFATDTSCHITPIPYPAFAVLEIQSCSGGSCDTVYSNTCFSPITDTLVNPYVYGLLGNYRAHRSYAYYGKRAEQDPLDTTNIQSNGTFFDFKPFWKLQSQKWLPQYDTTRWVWNSELTLFNKKGFELENKDPLGRYNAGLYGYNSTLPVAVVQNSRYRESAFEGFEDIAYKFKNCDSQCQVNRHFDFGPGVNERISDRESHTGFYSLVLNEDSKFRIEVGLQSVDTAEGGLSVTLQTTSCQTGFLKSIKSNSKTLLPNFTLIPGKKILLSAWVKEVGPDCKCTTYSNNKIVISYDSVTTEVHKTFYPSGSIIDGWQRYECIVDLGASDSAIQLQFFNLTTSTETKVYFDDIRVHPYNANMKSFVYDPVSLRLMAELDENNYATFYEYDDDGTLIRVKKETERGVKTIKETRSGLIKN